MWSSLNTKLSLSNAFLSQALQVNLTARFILARDFGAHMLTRLPSSSGRRGTTVNVAYILSFQGGITVPAYAASKGDVA